MSKPSRQPRLLRLCDIARSYGIKGQCITTMNKTHGLEVDDWLSPTDVHSFLCKFGNDSPLRRRLSDPREIIAISKRIVNLLEAKGGKPPSRSLEAVAGFVATGEVPASYADKNFALNVFRSVFLAEIEKEIAADIAAESQSPA